MIGGELIKLPLTPSATVLMRDATSLLPVLSFKVSYKTKIYWTLISLSDSSPLKTLF